MIVARSGLENRGLGVHQFSFRQTITHEQHLGILHILDKPMRLFLRSLHESELSEETRWNGNPPKLTYSGTSNQKVGWVITPTTSSSRALCI